MFFFSGHIVCIKMIKKHKAQHGFLFNCFISHTPIMLI